jgi:coniferyl-aldehyde dehydrogenase
MNSGQLCVSPDYCFVPQGKLEAFIKRCRDVMAGQYPTIQGNPDFTACINERHFDRVKAYIDEARERGTRVVPLCAEGEAFSQREAHKIAPHLIIDPDDDLACMQDEVFGAVLNIKTYDDLDQALAFINSRERPLALYYFGDDAAEQQRVLSETISGGVSINSIAMHVACDDLPFGGIGHSGIGNYRGFDGFRTFSHARGVYKEGWLNLAKLGGTLPPYGQKLDKMLSSQIKK